MVKKKNLQATKFWKPKSTQPIKGCRLITCISKYNSVSPSKFIRKCTSILETD